MDIMDYRMVVLILSEEVKMVKVSIDAGFGSCKIAVCDNGVITEMYKETMSYVELPSEDKLGGQKYDDKDTDIIRSVDGKVYRIGESAKLEYDKKLINVIDYKTMKLAAPLLVKKYLRKYPRADQFLVSLSLAFSAKQEEFQQSIDTETQLGNKLIIVPQSCMAKVALDNIGLDIDNPTAFPYKNYLLLDIGFNTVDSAVIINGRTTPTDRGGFEGEGVCKLATYVQQQIQEQLGYERPFPEMRDILFDRGFSVRGKFIDCSKIIDEGTKFYLNELYKFIEAKYGKKLDMLPNMVLVGGGAELIKLHIDFFNNLYDKEFALTPKTKAEFYNTLGALYLGDK